MSKKFEKISRASSLGVDSKVEPSTPGVEQKVEEEPPIVDASEIKRRFLLANNLEAIDESMHAYLSVTTIQQMLTTVLGPVMMKAKKESEFVSKLQRDIEAINVVQDAANKEIKDLRRGYKQFDEINRTSMKLEQDQRLAFTQIENLDRVQSSANESLKTDIQRINRQMEIDEQKHSNLKDRLDMVAKDLANYKFNMVEEMSMHNEDLYSKMNTLKSKIKKAENKVSQCVETNELTLEKLEDFQRHLDKNSTWCKELDESVIELYQKKLDIRVYNDQMDEMKDLVNQMTKRLSFDEYEFQNFGEYVCRYMPIMFQNCVTENLNSCLDAKALEMFQVFNTDKMNKFKNNIRNKMIYQLHIRDQQNSLFTFADEQQVLTAEYLATRQEQERKLAYEIKKAQEAQAKEIQDNMSLKIMRANDELEKKTKSKINLEVQRIQQLQEQMEKRLVGGFEAKQEALMETNRKLQRQITSISEEMGNKFHDLAKKAKKKVKESKEKSVDTPVARKSKKISEISPVLAKETKKTSKPEKESKKETKKVKVEKVQENEVQEEKEEIKQNSDHLSIPQDQQRKKAAVIKDSFSEFSFSESSEEQQTKKKKTSKKVKSIKAQNDDTPAPRRKPTEKIIKQDTNAINEAPEESSEEEAVAVRPKKIHKKITELEEEHESSSGESPPPTKVQKQDSFTKEDLEDSQSESESESESSSDSEESIDMSNYFTRDEVLQLVAAETTKLNSSLDQQHKKGFDELKIQIELNREKTLQVEHFTRSVEEFAKQIQKKVDVKQNLIVEKLDQILKQHSREKSDQQTDRKNLVGRISSTERRIDDVFDSFQNMSTVILCLMENSCMQIRAEEQDDQDKEKIALMGQKSAHEINETEQKTVQQKLIGNYDFPQQVGTSPQVIRNPQASFKDEGSPSGCSKNHNILNLDPKCMSCSNMQGDLIKQFKLACLAYHPSVVVFRNIEFTRQQLHIFRKFLMGQCSKIIQSKQPFVSFGMSSKRIFDDMYLYLKEVNRTGKAFQDVTSQYWNLIYKNPGHMPPLKIPTEVDADDTASDFEKASHLNIVEIDNEVSPTRNYMKLDLGLPGGMTQQPQTQPTFFAFGSQTPSNINKSSLAPKTRQRASSNIRVSGNHDGASTAFTGSRHSVFARRKPSNMGNSPRGLQEGDKMKARYDFDPEDTLQSQRVSLNPQISKSRAPSPKTFVSQSYFTVNNGNDNAQKRPFIAPPLLNQNSGTFQPSEKRNWGVNMTVGNSGKTPQNLHKSQQSSKHSRGGQSVGTPLVMMGTPINGVRQLPPLE